MKKVILFTLIILSFEGINAQAKKKTSSPKTLSIDVAEFSDNSDKYINKTIRLDDIWYSHSGNIGSWSDVADLTLRKKDDTFEDLYGMMNYNNEDSNYYCRTIYVGGAGGLKVKVLIPKSKSQDMPNIKSGRIIITGVLLENDVIQIISISRKQ